MNKLFVSVISLMTALPIGAGLICRQSFTDISQEDKPFDNFEIGLLRENTALNIKEYAENSLENGSSYILKVTPTDKVKFSFLCYTESVEILEIYKGDDLQIGDEIEILRDSSHIFWDLNDTDCANMGFVNLMNENEEYLVFLEKKIENEPVYKTYPCLMSAIFSYSNRDNAVLTDNKFRNTGNNEFFTSDENALEILESVKSVLIEKYS